MLLDLLNENLINDAIARTLPEKTISGMLQQLAIEFHAFWTDNNAIKVWHLAILKASERDIAFNTFRFYAYAMDYSIELYEKLLPIDDSINELPNYTSLLEIYEKDMEQARLDWHKNDAIDKAIIEIAQHIKDANK